MKSKLIFKLHIAIVLLTIGCQNNNTQKPIKSKPSDSSIAQTDSHSNSTANPGEIKIGIQTWSTTNLDITTFRNGDTIPEAKTDKEWLKAAVDGKPAWCFYNNDPENGKKYGRLYNWYAVHDKRGLAPEGWHIPTPDEWTILIDGLGGDDKAVEKMKSQNGWNEGKNGNNGSGFNALPGGNRLNYGAFEEIGISGSWFCYYMEGSIGQGIKNVVYNWVDGSAQEIGGGGYSVRCLKDSK